jgi:hypothetical protein
MATAASKSPHDEALRKLGEAEKKRKKKRTPIQRPDGYTGPDAETRARWADDARTNYIGSQVSQLEAQRKRGRYGPSTKGGRVH